MERRTGWLIGRLSGLQDRDEAWLSPSEDSQDRAGWIPLVPNRLMKLVLASVPPYGGGDWTHWHPAVITGVETEMHNFEVHWIRIDCGDGNIVEIDVAANKVINNPYLN